MAIHKLQPTKIQLLTVHETNLQATNGLAYPLGSLAWDEAPILDACVVHAEYGHLLLLTANGVLFGINFDTGAKVRLCAVELSVIDAADHANGYFGAPQHRLHASSDGRYAAIVVDKGRYGVVVDTATGVVTMRLDGGDYHEETVPFSACFLRFEGNNVLVHRTAWNRLDAADPATGTSLTDRHIAPYEVAGERPAHYLDYFHGQLRPSPDGSRLFDDGWVWQPVSIPRVWSVTDWLHCNPWESEDGTSIVDLTMRDDWTTPACWIDERRLALWGLADWDEDEFAETGQGPGVRILDVTESKQSTDGRWPMDIHVESVVSDLFSDGTCLYVASNTGTTIWDIAQRTQVAVLPGFSTRLLDPTRKTLLVFGADTLAELSLAWAATQQ